MDDKLIRGQRVQTFCLLILSGFALSLSMYFLSAALIPFVLAVFIYYCLSPVIEVQVQKLRLPRALAIFSTFIIGCAFLFMVGLLILTAAEQIGVNRDAYLVQIRELSHNIWNYLPLDKLKLNPEQIFGTVDEFSANMIKSVSKSVISETMNILSNGVLVLVFLIFILAGKSGQGDPNKGVLADIESQMTLYIRTLLFTSSLTGLLVGVTLWLLGVQFAYVFGFLTFLLNFIPSIGSIIATLLPLPVVFLSPEMSVGAKILAMLIPAVIQFGIGNIVQPRIMGKSLNLHPITVLLSLIFFGVIWNVAGMFLATPITGIVRIMMSKFDYTRPVAEVMAGRLGENKKVQS